MTQNCFYICAVVYLTISKGRSLSDIENSWTKAELSCYYNSETGKTRNVPCHATKFDRKRKNNINKDCLCHRLSDISHR